LAEQQLIDPNLLASIAAAARAKSHTRNVTDNSENPWPTDSHDVLERMLGCFVGPGGDVSHIFEVTGAGCCTGNSPVGLFDAWKSIVRYRDGQATVNLLLNRASPWVDVDSYLPYEGRIRLRNKTAKSLAVRIPGWVNLD